MKITIGGEAFSLDLDFASVKMAQALEIERAAGRRYVEWESELMGGSAEATCVLIWLAWNRDGRDAELADILAGKFDIDFSETYRSFMKALGQQLSGAEAARENPTPGAEPRTDPDGTPMTQSATKGSSRKSST